MESIKKRLFELEHEEFGRAFFLGVIIGLFPVPGFGIPLHIFFVLALKLLYSHVSFNVTMHVICMSIHVPMGVFVAPRLSAIFMLFGVQYLIAGYESTCVPLAKEWFRDPETLAYENGECAMIGVLTWFFFALAIIVYVRVLFRQYRKSKNYMGAGFFDPVKPFPYDENGNKLDDVARLDDNLDGKSPKEKKKQ